MRKKILLVNPPIYDFSAYDFWLKPYGLLRVGGYLRDKADLFLFDYLDRSHVMNIHDKYKVSDPWGRGHFYRETIAKPDLFKSIRRNFKRFGAPRLQFENYLAQHGPFDVVLIQTGMTYWYPGLNEVIQDLRCISPHTNIILGGVYATLCTQHASGLGADLVVPGTDLSALWRYLELQPDLMQPPLWDLYQRLDVGALKLSDGCAFRCTYCSVPNVYQNFYPRDLNLSFNELSFLHQLGVHNIAFYDDMLLYRADEVLKPFLNSIIDEEIDISFHTPNALNARLLTKEIALLMVKGGFKSFYIGLESKSDRWHSKTGRKVHMYEFERAVSNLVESGVNPDHITAYILIGHPEGNISEVEDTMHYAHSLGIQVMLAEFSPIPGTPDGDECMRWVDLNEPLWHNKTVFPMLILGQDEVNHLKSLCHQLNRNRAVA
ncbi:MAG: B12-binding domain-containing radical SAM protein [Chlamydiota bacterium]|nr:B12-binding domain-containing radical SAM protein [Chlamydiota bacterium]